MEDFRVYASQTFLSALFDHQSKHSSAVCNQSQTLSQDRRLKYAPFGREQLLREISLGLWRSLGVVVERFMACSFFARSYFWLVPWFVATTSMLTLNSFFWLEGTLEDFPWGGHGGRVHRPTVSLGVFETPPWGRRAAGEIEDNFFQSNRCTRCRRGTTNAQQMSIPPLSQVVLSTMSAAIPREKGGNLFVGQGRSSDFHQHSKVCPL